MLKPTFIIFVETVTGETIKAFTWCRDAASGIERAKRDAELFGVKPGRVWAQPVCVGV